MSEAVQQIKIDKISITSQEANQRLDKILGDRYHPSYSRTYFQQLIENQQVLLNGIAIKKKVLPIQGDQIEIKFSLMPPEIKVLPEAIPLDLLYEDEHLLAINKPVGLITHPASGHWTGTFVNAVLHHCQQLNIENEQRPGIVHRLDKDTTGVLLAAKYPVAQQRLTALFALRQIRKDYLAICINNPGHGEIKASIGRHPVHRKLMSVVEKGGKDSFTTYETLTYNGQLSLVNLRLITGRTHQIRVHMKHLGFPVLGDPLYGNISINKKFKESDQIERQLLHAHCLQFIHPMTQEKLTITAPLPQDMTKLINRIDSTGILKLSSFDRKFD